LKLVDVGIEDLDFDIMQKDCRREEHEGDAISGFKE
jgi:hypothetical protein